MTLTAQCSNCASWRLDPAPGRPSQATGFCMQGLLPDEGKPLCGKYQVSVAFKNEIISTMLKEGGPMAMPVKLIGGRKSAKKLRRH